MAEVTYFQMRALCREGVSFHSLVAMDACRSRFHATLGPPGGAFPQVASPGSAECSGGVERSTSRAHLAEIASFYAQLKTLRAEAILARERLGADLAAVEAACITLSDELRQAGEEREALRGMITSLRGRPLLQLRDNLRHFAERHLAKCFARIGSPQALKYERYAAKRDPRRPVVLPELRPQERSPVAKPAAAGFRADGPALNPVVELPFVSPLGGELPPLRLAVVLHLFYVEQAASFLEALSAVPVPYTLLITTDTEAKAAQLRKVFEAGNAVRTELRVVPNRGRDIAPKLFGFAERYEDFDLLLFLHSKASLHAEALLAGWRDYLLKGLLGSPQVVQSILEAFAQAPELGMLAPPGYPPIRGHLGWCDNFEAARELAEKMGISLTIDSPLDFPAGSMFWARPAALRPLLDAGIRLEDFPEEAGQTDGTLAHAIERLFFYACERAGLRWIHAAQRDQLVEGDVALPIRSEFDLARALSDQMPALLLPGRRPFPGGVEDAALRLARCKQVFREHCRQDLRAFLDEGKRMDFTPASGCPRLSIVLVLYNQAELTFHCLESLQRDAESPFELIILDNQSTDATAALLDRLDGATVLRSPGNLHFLRGVNRAAKVAKGEYLLLLNNDARVLPGTLAAAMGCLDGDASIGAVGGPIALLDGTLQEAGSLVFRDGSCLGYGRGRDPAEPEFCFQREVDFCSGAFLMMRRSLWETLGGFDEAFAPAYYEEVDLCLRMWAEGYRVVYEPRAKIVHFEFGSAASSDAAIEQQRVNHRVFLAKHGAVLATDHLPSSVPPVVARQRRNATPRILVIDDRVPDARLGAGFPRAVKYLEVMAELGVSVTLYPTSVPCFSVENAYDLLPRTTELVCSPPGCGLVDFLRERRACYDAVFVSRPHNMVRFREAVGQVMGWEAVPVIYDAEAIFAERDIALAGLWGDFSGNPVEALQRELALTDGVRTVFSVSESEAATFREYGHLDVRILSHAVSPRPLGCGPPGRRNLLFVGPLVGDYTPNTESLNWFIREVMPRIDALMGRGWSLEVVGRFSAPSLSNMGNERIRWHGQVDCLDGFYANARLFIAPTRLSAGIPLKVVEAASVGLPVVASGKLVSQLGWRDGWELLAASDADAFAEACVRLYEDDVLWARLRQGGLSVITREYSHEGFRESLRGALKGVLRRGFRPGAPPV